MTYQERSSAGRSSSGRELAAYRGQLSRKVLGRTGHSYEAFELESPGPDPVSRLCFLADRDRRAVDTIRRLGEDVDEADLWISLVRIGCCPRVIGDTAWRKLSEDSPPMHLKAALIQLLDRHFSSDHEAISILERRATDLEFTAQCERLIAAATQTTVAPESSDVV